jgi:NifB/MoaA-like Fe-S oxidoreductase
LSGAAVVVSEGEAVVLEAVGEAVVGEAVVGEAVVVEAVVVEAVVVEAVVVYKGEAVVVEAVVVTEGMVVVVLLGGVAVVLLVLGDSVSGADVVPPNTLSRGKSGNSNPFSLIDATARSTCRCEPCMSSRIEPGRTSTHLAGANASLHSLRKAALSVTTLS